MANKVARYLIQNGEFQDDVLHRTCFPVNIRLLKENWSYMHIIEGIIFFQ